MLESVLDSERRRTGSVVPQEYARTAYDIRHTIDGTIRVYERILTMGG